MHDGWYHGSNVASSASASMDEEEEDVDRRERGGGPVGREQDRKHAVIERLDTYSVAVSTSGGRAARGGQRVARLDEGRATSSQRRSR